MSDERYTRGWERLAAVNEAAARDLFAALADVAPDFSRFVVEFAFGDVYTRPGLDPKSRQIATIASLATLGNAQPQLEAHIQGALNVGCTRQEIVEVLMQMAIYAGFPAAINALLAAKEVFAAQPTDEAPA
jgi:4-carboxymuconolactone decarboxylase